MISGFKIGLQDEASQVNNKKQPNNQFLCYISQTSLNYHILLKKTENLELRLFFTPNINHQASFYLLYLLASLNLPSSDFFKLFRAQISKFFKYYSTSSNKVSSFVSIALDLFADKIACFTSSSSCFLKVSFSFNSFTKAFLPWNFWS